MPEFTLKRNIVKTLKVNIGDDSCSIPLGGSLTPQEWAGLDTFAGTVEFMRKYIPAEIADTLTLDEWNAIIEAWKIETSKGGKTAGE